MNGRSQGRRIRIRRSPSVAASLLTELNPFLLNVTGQSGYELNGLSSGASNVCIGSKPEKLNASKCFPLFTQQRTSPRYFGMSVSCHKRTSGWQRTMSIHRLRLREFPCAVEDFGARAIEAHHVIPAWHGWQAVADLAVAAAELDGDRAVRAFLRGDTV